MYSSILDQYFSPQTMSVHFKENTAWNAKIGKPGARKSQKSEQIISKQDCENLINTLFKEIEARNDSFLEIDKPLFKVIQMGTYRIVIVHPPLSDGIELTIVRPIKQMHIEEYNLPSDLFDLLKNKAQGVLICGAPGSGKTTFAQALIEVYAQADKIIKTLESPRDLLVGDEIVQYSFSYGSHNDLRDILLLSRPDYTIYDEVRNNPDFELFKDLRLAGIGLIGVMHATKAIDSIQRFLGSIEMGIIPQVIDTILFMSAGKIETVYQLGFTVKMPTGMQSGDLSRPVIEVKDFHTQKIVYEIYSFGEQIVVMPLDKLQNTTTSNSGLRALGQHMLEELLQRVLDVPFILKIHDETNVRIYLPEEAKGSFIGKAGSNIQRLEKQIGMHISAKTFEEIPFLPIKLIPTQGHSKKEKKQSMTIEVGSEYSGQKLRLAISDHIQHITISQDGTTEIREQRIIKALQKGIGGIVNENLL